MAPVGAAPQIPVSPPTANPPAPAASIPTLPLTAGTVVPEIKFSAPPEVPAPPPPPVEDSTEALRQQAARLQEQLSSMLFAETSTTNNASVSAPLPPLDAAALSDTTAKILEFANPVPAPPAIALQPIVVEPPKAAIEHSQPIFEIPKPAAITAPPVRSLLEADEEVKIPAWLEPLARNATAPASTQELIEREKAKHAAALHTKHDLEELAAEPLPAPVSEGPLDLQVPTFGSGLPLDQPQFSSEVSSKSSKTVRWLGLVAAALFAAAFGGWYLRQQSSPAQAARVAVSPNASMERSNSLESQPQTRPPATSLGSPASAGVQPNQTANSSSLAAPRNQSVPASASAPAAALLNANARVDVARTAEPAPPAAQPKKPSLGEVRLGAPTVNRNGAAVNANEPEPAIEGSTGTASNTEGLGSGILASNAKQPSAPSVPLPVGGDVKSAKLISSIPPVYSTLAKAQHVSGDVKIDALIDATGHVTTMKVVSGPTLLHQSAMDALRQWRYQPATLDGKAVPMHLTVTIQFRMQ
jgi:protein TonB